MRKLMVALAMGLIVSGGVAQTIKVGKDNRTITVTGVGTASAEPELAGVHVGFKTYGATLGSAYKSASDMSNGIVKALTDAGVTKSEIESQSQSVQGLAEYELKNLPSSLKGMKYRATQSWIVKVPVKDAARILDVAIQAGAGESGQVDWLMKDSTLLERAAVAKASARVKALADEMASGLGVRLGVLVYATNESSEMVPMMRNQVRFSAGVVAQDAMAPLAIEAQRIERSVTVHATYAIE